MDEKVESGSHGQQPKPEAPPPTKPIAAPVVVPPVDPPPVQLNGEGETEDGPNKMSRTDKIMSASTVVIAIFTVVLAVVSYLQWREIRAGEVDTHNLAVAAGNQATWTQHLKETTDTESLHMQELARHMKDQADRTKDLADQAKAQAAAAQTTADAAKDAAATASKQLGDFESVQSAELVVDMEPEPCNSPNCKAKVTATNVGATAAKQIFFFQSGGYWKWAGPNPTLMTGVDEQRIFSGIQIPEPVEWGIALGSGESHSFELSIPSPDSLDLSKSGFLVYGLIAYRDVFGAKKVACTNVLFSTQTKQYLWGVTPNFCPDFFRARQQGQAKKPN